MSAPLTELFTGGLVNVRHPALLGEGELQRADDCVYRDKDEAIWRAPGRTALNSTALGTSIRGIGHLSFDAGYVDQFVALGRATSGTPTWASGPDTLYPGQHLYGAAFTAISGLSFTEIGGQGLWTGVLTNGASGVATMESQIVYASCTIAGDGITVTAASLANIEVGMVVSGTGVTAGTKVLSITNATTIVLNTAATPGTVTLTFNQYPFLASAVGAKLIGTGIGTGVYITAVSNQDGTTGHYRTATLSVPTTGPPSNATYNYVITWGGAYNFQNTGNETLDFVQYGARKYYLWDGVGNLQCIEWKSRANATDPTLGAVLSLRPVSLKPVESAFTITLNTGQSTGWNAVKGAGKYWFLITEIFSPSSDIATALKDPELRGQIVESAYLAATNSTTADNGSQSGIGLPLGQIITTVASENITITFPAVTNNGRDGYVATHWGIYIYGPSSELPSLAQMRRCATVPIRQMTAGATFLLTDASLTQIKWPTAITTVGAQPSFGHSDYLISDAAINDFDGKMAYTKVGGSGKSIPDNAAQRLRTYGFSTSGSYASKTPYGVELQVCGAANPSGDTGGSCRYWVRLVTTAGKTTDTILGEFGSTRHTNRHGGPMDTLGVAWTDTDPAIMEVEIGIANRGFKDELDLDSVAIKIYYTTTNVDFNGPAYRVVTYRDQVGLTVSDPARLRPPRCSTGDFFQGSLVLNNLEKENQINYSLPGDIEAWPKPYEMGFNTRKKDKVTFIKSLGTILFVGMENSLKRVNYLPTEANTDMNSGLAHEDIASDHGIPGPFAATKFDMPGEGSLIAYASQVGIFISNGIWTRPLNLDLDWSATVKVSALPTSVMKVYPKEKWIAFYYCPVGATHSRNTRVLYFCYQADKLKQGGMGVLLPAVGPCVVSARAACEAWLSSTPYLLTANEFDGKVYVEDSGITIPSGYQVTLTATSATQGDGKEASATDVSINPLIRTRKIYPSGVEQDSFGEKLLVLFTKYGSRSLTASSTAVAGSAVVTSSAAFGSVLPGMLVTGTGIDGGTIVLSKASSSSITLSRVANSDAGVATLTFDTGTIGITIRGSGVSEDVYGHQTVYSSTTRGDLLATSAPEISQGFELQFEKVPLTFDSNGDTLTRADLSVNMRLHQFTYVLLSAGREMNRAT